ncbi:amidohydrolase family protein [Microbacterium dextranolyticum]|uniref:Cytosine deaminase n=1 Tax=Microbacterium dextranolyticum TaxID=36806 RepID=A0A9W6HLE6_9MICO|nr:amidohydrolase family protein [Microbacterium dextranolyticum]MBM7463479.1 cytosine deaminase [Microbacterium dextranolyticum]GLJ95420.1 cytosine deaminase [Microbacterium dextranolyticum]
MSSPLSPVTLIRNVRVPYGGADHAVDIAVEGDTITAVPPADRSAASTATAPGSYDGRGLLALPGLVNAHAHIDKSWWGLPWQSYGGEGTTEGRIRHERARRDEIGMPSVEITRRVLDQFVAHGTTALRTHVDVDLGLGLRGIEVVREALAAYGGALTAQIVAFPQDGVLRRPGVLALLEQAAREGVDHIGGLDPATIDRDPVGQIDALVGLSAEHGVGIDIHLHDPAELGAFQIELVLDRVERLGLEGRVTIAHGFAVAQLADSRRRDLLARMGEAGVTMTTVAPLRLPQLPLHELDEHGVAFAFGTDGVRDLWSPYGTGDLLGIAWQYARASSLVHDDDLRRVVEIATGAGAPFAGLPANELRVGDRADIVLIDAENPMDSLVRTPPREAVIAGGRLLVG